MLRVKTILKVNELTVVFAKLRVLSTHLSSSVYNVSWRSLKRLETRCRKLLLRLLQDPYRFKENYITAHPDVSWWEQHLNSRVISEASSLLSGYVADFGCNHWACTLLVARKMSRVVGIDRNMNALRYANSLKKRECIDDQSKIDFICARLTELPFANNSLGGGFLIDVLEHIYEKDLAILTRELKRVLKKGAKIQIVTPFEHAYDDGLQHVTFFDSASLTRLLNDSGMKIIKIERDRRSDVYTPQGHNRINALVEMI